MVSSPLNPLETDMHPLQIYAPVFSEEDIFLGVIPQPPSEELATLQDAIAFGRWQFNKSGTDDWAIVPLRPIAGLTNVTVRMLQLANSVIMRGNRYPDGHDSKSSHDLTRGLVMYRDMTLGPRNGPIIYWNLTGLGDSLSELHDKPIPREDVIDPRVTINTLNLRNVYNLMAAEFEKVKHEAIEFKLSSQGSVGLGRGIPRRRGRPRKSRWT
ncbi:uncharacterized protein FIBRA_04306 [Fibroporia radiculosa]|uniref:Uncharacterized protein n=1 Tax=Fibroporia radiculosa TaxID=599839 RepID=J4IA36_9APHY|nr:uncharacterized protein FIBRA_04306 [Fibroporia radiculosa]CCM02226.1 predicted protein [Fibroporia radiculosa]